MRGRCNIGSKVIIMKTMRKVVFLLMIGTLSLQAQVMHVATKQGDVKFRVQDVDSVYFNYTDSIKTDTTNTIIPDSTNVVPDTITVSLSDLQVFKEQKNFYPSDLFTQSHIMCHRGLPGYPENTKEAILAAIKVGYKMLECDVARTSDGVFVLQHDATIDRCSNGTGRVDSYTFEELLQFDFGSWYNPDFSFVKIAPLEDIIKLCKRKNVVLELDIADNNRFSDSYLPDLFNLVQKHGMLSRTVFCASQSRLESLQTISSCVCISVSGIRDIKSLRSALLLKQKSLCINVSVPFDKITPEMCELAHSNGMYVKTWTYNFDADADAAFEKGADYVIVQNVLPPFGVSKEKK